MRTTIYLQYLVFLLFIKGFLSVTAGNGQVVHIDNATCPDICSSCVSKYIQGYTQTDVDVTSLRGCTVNGTINPDVGEVASTRTYTENHIINLKDINKPQKVYLNLKEEDGSTHLPQSIKNSITTRKYVFALISSQPVTWIVSYNSTPGGAEYIFKVPIKYQSRTKGGFVINHATGQDESKYFDMPDNYVRYVSGQIKNNIPKEAFGEEAPSSFIELKKVDFMQLTVGLARWTETPQDCNFRGNLPADFVQASYLGPIVPSQNCSIKRVSGSSSNLVYVVDVDDLESNTSSVRLELDGIADLEAGTRVTIILFSTNSVNWIARGDVDKDISAAIQFRISNGSRIDKSNLAFSDDAGEATEATVTSHGGRVLEKVAHIYNVVHAYSKFNQTPNIVKIKIKEKEHSTPDVPKKPVNVVGFLQTLSRSITCSSSDARISINRRMFQEFNVNESQLVFGDGSCKVSWVGDNFIVSTLGGGCGLEAISYDMFKFPVNLTIGKDILKPVLRCMMPLSNVSLEIYDHVERAEPVKFPVKIFPNISKDFYAELTLSSKDQYAINFNIERCYLHSEDKKGEIILIQNNCPTSRSVWFLAPSSTYPHKQIFGFSLQRLQNVYGSASFSITCELSKCVSKCVTDEKLSLRKCPHEHGHACDDSQDQDVVNQDSFTIELVKGSFSYSHEVEPVKDIPDSHATVGLGSGLVVGITFLAFAIGILLVCAIWKIHALSQSLQPPGITNKCSYSQVSSHSDSGENLRFRTSSSSGGGCIYKQQHDKFKIENGAEHLSMSPLVSPTFMDRHLVQVVKSSHRSSSPSFGVRQQLYQTNHVEDERRNDDASSSATGDSGVPEPDSASFDSIPSASTDDPLGRMLDGMKEDTV